jgi:hypothetical protein
VELDSYSVILDNLHETYKFFSEGPNGNIKKIIAYQKIGDDIYNLAFGDWNEYKNRINDNIRTNNNDREKILHTIASTVIDFVKHHPQATVFAKGSTPARTRLYQIGIANKLKEIDQLFEIEGLYKSRWERFQKGKNYQAFTLKTKQKL